MATTSNIDNLTRVFTAAVRHYLPEQTKIHIECESHSRDTKMSIVLPVAPSRPGEIGETLVVNHILSDHMLDMDFSSLAQMAETYVKEAARTFNAKIEENARPAEEVMALLAMAKLEARYSASDKTWNVHPILPPGANHVHAGTDIDDCAGLDEWRHLVTAILDRDQVKAKYPNLSVHLAKAYNPRAQERNARMHHDAMMRAPDDRIRRGGGPNPFDQAWGGPSLDARYQEQMRRESFARLRDTLVAQGVPNPERYLLDPRNMYADYPVPPPLPDALKDMPINPVKKRKK